MTAGPLRRGGAAAWLRASRLPSQSYIALPLLVGQALAASRGHRVRLGVLAAVQLFGLLDQLYIVWANDYADRETDRRNRTPTLFSGGSRVLVEGGLEPASLLRAAAWAGALALAASFALAARSSPLLVPLALSALALLWAYSFSPLRMSYRGGGELLQAAGTALVLPLYGYCAQAGGPGGFPWPAVAVLFPAQLACALATTMPDEPSDREGEKRTASVRFGLGATFALVVALELASVAAFLVLPWSPRGAPSPSWVLPSLAATAFGLAFRGARPGTRALTLRVGSAVFATLALDGAMLGALVAP